MRSASAPSGPSSRVSILITRVVDGKTMADLAFGHFQHQSVIGREFHQLHHAGRTALERPQIALGIQRHGARRVELRGRRSAAIARERGAAVAGQCLDSVLLAMGCGKAEQAQAHDK